MNQHETLINRYLDGQLSDDEWMDLVDWLADEPEHRRQFVHWTFEHRLLRDTLGGAVADERASPPTLASRIASFVRSYPVISSIAAAVVVGATLGLMAIYIVQPAVRWAGNPEAHDDLVVARVAGESQCVWDQSQGHVFDGAHLRPGRLLSLSSGVARVDFDDGARIILHGPASLRVESASRAMLSAGRLVSHVPPAARGFTITTPAATIVDLGTEFGVDARSEQTFVHVFRGEVEVSLADQQGGQKTTQRLTAGKSATFRGASSAEATDVDANSFVRSLPGDREDLLVYEPFGAGDHVALFGQGGGLGFGGSTWTGEVSDMLTSRAFQLQYQKNAGLMGKLGHFENRNNIYHQARLLRRVHSTNSIDLARDGEYYVSFLARKYQHDSLGLVGLVEGSTGRGIDVGWTYSGDRQKADPIAVEGIGGQRTASAMPNGADQFFVVKIIAHATAGDQVFVKQYASAIDAVHGDPAELVGEGSGRDEWTLVTPEFHSDLVLNTLSLRSDGPAAFVQVDEIRLGKTWNAVTGL